MGSRKLFMFFIICSAVTYISHEQKKGFTFKNQKTHQLNYTPTKNALKAKNKRKKEKPNISIKDSVLMAKKRIYDRFRDSLSSKESSKKPKMVNSIGCVGLYQFCSNRLKDFGLSTDDVLRMDENNQNRLFDKHVQSIKKALKDYYQIAKNKGFSDGSIIAASHLAGANGFKQHLLNGYDPNDGITHLSDYVEMFSSFDGFW